MTEHYEVIKGTIRSQDTHQTILIKELHESKQEIERLNDLIKVTS